LLGGVVAWVNQLNVSAAHELGSGGKCSAASSAKLMEHILVCQRVRKNLHNFFLRQIKFATIGADHLADIQINSIRLDKTNQPSPHVTYGQFLWPYGPHTLMNTRWQLKNLTVEKVC